MDDVHLLLWSHAGIRGQLAGIDPRVAGGIRRLLREKEPNYLEKLEQQWQERSRDLPKMTTAGIGHNEIFHGEPVQIEPLAESEWMSNEQLKRWADPHSIAGEQHEREISQMIFRLLAEVAR